MSPGIAVPHQLLGAGVEVLLGAAQALPEGRWRRQGTQQVADALLVGMRSWLCTMASSMRTSLRRRLGNSATKQSFLASSRAVIRSMSLTRPCSLARALSSSSSPARTGAVAFIHRFGASLNPHPHFHVVVIDGVVEPDPERGARFIAAEELDAADASPPPSRGQALRAFERRGRLGKEDGREMEQWEQGGAMRIIAVIPEAVDARAILAHIGEPAIRPGSPKRGGRRSGAKTPSGI